MAVIKPGYMLEHPSIRRYSFDVTPSSEDVSMSSENPSGADNQQETVRSMLELDPRWVIGFVDGEGCFSRLDPSRTRTLGRPVGWQLHPVFHVVPAREVIEQCSKHWSASSVAATSAPKGPNSSVWTFAVDSLRRISRTHVASVLRAAPARSSRQHDFARVRRVIVDAMRAEGAPRRRRVRTARPACLRDERARQAAEPTIERDPDGILRDCTPGTLSYASLERVKIQSDPHGDMRSQAEMT